MAGLLLIAAFLVQSTGLTPFFFSVLVAGGLVSLGLYSCIYYINLRESIRLLREQYYLRATIILNISIIIMITGVFNNGLLLAFLWMFLGLVSALSFQPCDNTKPSNNVDDIYKREEET